MAADKQLTCSDGQKLRRKKIRRVKIGQSNVLVACAGDAEANEAFHYWLANLDKLANQELDIHYPTKEDFHALVLYDTGYLLWYGPKGYPVEVKDRFHGIGSGSGYALGALHAGATIRDAIRIATKLDSNTGFGVQVEGFK